MKKQVVQKATRKQYSREFKQQALQRAEQDGVPQAAQDLGLKEGLLYTWRGKAKQEGQTSEEQRLLQSEHARLKREVSRLEEENAFLKNRLRGSPRPRWIETISGYPYTDIAPGQRPPAFWRHLTPSKNLARGNLRTELWWHLA